MTSILDKITAPAVLRTLSMAEQNALAAELREQIIRVVAANGGHLAPNLGVVELTIALLNSFAVPADRIVWDVGHQCYAYKILTGRRKEFATLRAYGGLAGFPVRGESEFECYGGGHAGIAISAALGMCAAQEPTANDKVIAVVGDGALNSGVALEGLNNAKSFGRNLIIVLNDNKMAIAPNVGAIAACLNRVIVGARYRNFKNWVKSLLGGLPRGESIIRRIRKIAEVTKGFLLPGGLFEELGLRYIGPINGHDLAALEHTFKNLRNSDEPVLVHVVTEKGHGYQPAAANPEHYHGVGRFDPATGVPEKTAPTGYGFALGAALTGLAERDSRVVAVVAAMCGGTGLDEFARRFPARFFDAGIAESHAVTFASGLAAGGLRPVVAIYATFMQRALDNIFHDVCLMNLPVIFALDRSGVVEDGPTHHGIYDLGFLRSLPNLTVMMPRCEAELAAMLEFAVTLNAPVALRYPRGASGDDGAIPVAPLELGKSETVRSGDALAIWALGRECVTALHVAANIQARLGRRVKVVNVRFVAPLDVAALRADAAQMPVMTIENHSRTGGLAEAAAAALGDASGRLKSFGWPRERIPHGEVAELRRRFGLDEASLTAAAAAMIGGEDENK